MPTLTEKLIKDALFLWSTIDPIGTLALFAGLTAHMSAEKRRHTALLATLYSAILLVAAIIAGQLFLTYMGIQLISLKVSGGIILFLFGLQMVFKDQSQKKSKEPHHDLAVFPLAIPSIASPGAIMAAIILTDNNTYNITTQVCTGLVMLGVLIITCIFMLLAGKIMKVIGKNGSAILIKLMGMILAALSIEIIMSALKIPQWINGSN